MPFSRGNHARRDADPKDGVAGEIPGGRDNANHVKKASLRVSQWVRRGVKTPLANEYPSFRAGHDFVQCLIDGLGQHSPREFSPRPAPADTRR